MPQVYISAFGGVGTQFFDNNGVILSGGKIYSYEAGTTTPAITYTSSTRFLGCITLRSTN